MAEKYSRFRDPGTGIQVFLTPVCSSSTSMNSGLASARLTTWMLTPIWILLGLVRSLLALVGWLIYVCGSAVGLRLVLFALGFVRLPLDPGDNKRDPDRCKRQRVQPQKRDLVLANHSSWIDLLIVAYLYPGVKFLVPVIDDARTPQTTPPNAHAQSVPRRTPKKNAMSAHTNMDTRTPSAADIVVTGYAILGLSQAIWFVGGLAPSRAQLDAATRVYASIDRAISHASCALVMFPEGTTCNNRALLSMSVLPTCAPATIRTTHLVTLKYSPPTRTSISSIYTTRTPNNSIVRHAARLVFLCSPLRSVLLKSAVLPSHPTAWPDHVASAISNLARLKTTTIHWSAKADFLHMVETRSRRA